MCLGLSGSVCPYWPRYKQLVWQFVWPLIHKERRASCGEEGLSPRAWSVCSHTQTHLTHKPKSSSSVNTDPCERPGFMELMGGCMGTFPGGSFCLFFWWRRRRRRPSSSHHDDRRAEKESRGRGVYQCCRSPVRNNCRGNSPSSASAAKNLQKLIMWEKEGWWHNGLEKKPLSRFRRKKKIEKSNDLTGKIMYQVFTSRYPVKNWGSQRNYENNIQHWNIL